MKPYYSPESTPGQTVPVTAFKTLRQMEAVMIEQALKRHQVNRAATARELGINVTTLFRKLKSLDMDS